MQEELLIEKIINDCKQIKEYFNLSKTQFELVSHLRLMKNIEILQYTNKVVIIDDVIKIIINELNGNFVIEKILTWNKSLNDFTIFDITKIIN